MKSYRNDDMKEKILFPALKTGDKQISITQDVDGGHSSIIKHIIGIGNSDMIDFDQMGFITSKGRFVDRFEAKRIAVEANQIKLDMSNSGELFSCELDIEYA